MNKSDTDRIIQIIQIVLSILAILVAIISWYQVTQINIELNEFKAQTGEFSKLTTGKICFTQNCSSYEYYNGTGVVIQG
jgi:hypothetical protein